MNLSPRAVLMGLGLFVSASVIDANEGMWLFSDPPRKILKEQYGFEPTDQWLEHVQKSSVRFNSGGSGSFVSPEGLVLSNHHVGADCCKNWARPRRTTFATAFTRALAPRKCAATISN
jgi:S1-C subfamily serine protease